MDGALSRRGTALVNQTPLIQTSVCYGAPGIWRKNRQCLSAIMGAQAAANPWRAYAADCLLGPFRPIRPPSPPAGSIMTDPLASLLRRYSHRLEPGGGIRRKRAVAGGRLG